MTGWRASTWGDEVSLEYGKSLRDYAEDKGPFRVFGSNGPVGWTDQPLAPGPGVILGRKGAYRGVRFSSEPFYVIDTAYYVVPKTELDMHWLYYAIIYHKLGEIDDGSPIPSTTRSAVYVRDIDVPKLHEQKAIAAVLSALDDKIALNRRMNETLEASARALFRDWFVDFGPTRAKMAGTAPYLAADIWSLFPGAFDDEGKPEGWGERPLDQIADFLNGLALQKFPAKPDAPSLPVIKIAELRSGITGNSNRASFDVPTKYIIEDGDFLFSWSGSLLAKFWTEGRGALNQHLFKVSSSEFPAWFYSQWVWHHLEEFQRIAASKATTMGHIQRGHLTAAQTVCPPSNVIEVLGKTMKPRLGQIIANQLQSRTLAETRDFLLPKLMSGEIRVAQAEQLVGDKL
jgi:type I restriction enzyme S subunit